MNSRGYATIFSLTCALFLVGCGGSKTGTVTGTVTLDGVPLERAVVTFMPDAGGRMVSAMTDEDGRFELYYTRSQKPLPVGGYAVRLRGENVETEGEGSELTREVKPGENDFEINFKSSVK